MLKSLKFYPKKYDYEQFYLVYGFEYDCNFGLNISLFRAIHTLSRKTKMIFRFAFAHFRKTFPKQFYSAYFLTTDFYKNFSQIFAMNVSSGK